MSSTPQHTSEQGLLTIAEPPQSLCLISDLHLCDEVTPHQDGPATVRAFARFTSQLALRDDCAGLIVLGDLFEVWIGDDAPADQASQAVTQAFQALRDAGKTVYMMHGNRDFLLGESFAVKAGCTLLPDCAVLQYGPHRIALVHGDAQCTDDLPYQQFRAMVRQPAWQAEFLRKPLRERQQIARMIRSESEINKSSTGYTDVNAKAAIELMQATQCPMLIHGHTHEGKSHVVHGLTDWPDAQRHVTSDWDARTQRGDALWITPRGIERSSVYC